MPRTISSDLATILAAPSGRRDLDTTIDLAVGGDLYYLATSPIDALNGHDYENRVDSFSEIRQTIEAPVDRVNVAIENKSLTLGLHVATYPEKWRDATAVVGRNYYEVDSDGERTGLSAWIEMFRGTVQQPTVDDSSKQVTIDIIPDTTALGLIVCNRTEAPLCPFKFKDTKTCAYSGAETTCDHHLRSPAGCLGRTNTHHFGGCEHYQEPNVNAPGTTLNPGGGGITGGGGSTGGGGGGGGDPDPGGWRPPPLLN